MEKLCVTFTAYQRFKLMFSVYIVSATVADLLRHSSFDIGTNMTTFFFLFDTADADEEVDGRALNMANIVDFFTNNFSDLLI